MSLLTLLQKFRNRRASDPRDKVYALLSLAKPNGKKQNILPDYILSEREVYIQATLEIISDTKSLAVLNTDTGRKFRHDLPSWVPDWDAPGAQTNDIRAEAIHLYNVMGLRGFIGMGMLQVLPASILELQAARTGVVTQVEETMWGDSADASRSTIRKWFEALESAIPQKASTRQPSVTHFWKLICADIFCGQVSSSSKVEVRRITPEDEITFVCWAVQSPRSPFNLRLYPNDRDDKEDKDDWSRNSYYSRIEDAWLDRTISVVARVWKNLLYLEMNTPSMGPLLPDLLWTDVTSTQMHEKFQPLEDDRKEILKRVIEGHGFYWIDLMIDSASGSIRSDAPWKEFFQDVEQKLAEKFGGKLHANTMGTTRRERIAAMDSSIMAATLSRRLFFTRQGDIGLAPADTRPGDEIYYIAGGKAPFILRHLDDGRVEHYHVVGDCYVLGMNDETPPDVRYRTINLV
ncbi:hypothetical protein N0V90_012742 [Kalmusia sp. IMI 367209]|nr:hypothetical protein N0V90_012742 [Kalmusia sp. IMI 367209]